MKNLILVALILVITVDINGYQFGDIISFKPSCLGNFIYQHFAIYVGDEVLPGKAKGQNIYERQRAIKSCVFSTLNTDQDPQVTNYLDGYTDNNGKVYTAGTKEEIIERIKQTKNMCWPYEVLGNNCEHHATYVRYGVKIALQFNMTGENLCFNNPFRIKTKDMVKYVRENAECHNNVAGLQVFPQLTLSAGLALLCFVLM
ncbi:phospholipase A and acyltransferase 1-like isoform X3 [Etheostoma cragini]|uniref:phospholipase A and acyltransferase 1-like isoform X3 n=1 Tax=Etheostoma cragini TaxID=417921 RepID=UPI00155E6F32|nr:phospholipase A and acyltransferase 1-like isoform X3 [Etheostoma cragini]